MCENIIIYMYIKLEKLLYFNIAHRLNFNKNEVN